MVKEQSGRRGVGRRPRRNAFGCCERQQWSACCPRAMHSDDPIQQTRHWDASLKEKTCHLPCAATEERALEIKADEAVSVGLSDARSRQGRVPVLLCGSRITGSSTLKLLEGFLFFGLSTRGSAVEKSMERRAPFRRLRPTVSCSLRRLRSFFSRFSFFFADATSWMGLGRRLAIPCDPFPSL